MDDRKYFVARTFRNNEEALKKAFNTQSPSPQSPDSRGFFCRFIVSIEFTMTITEIRQICLAFPGVTEDIKWGDHLCFNIGGKMFLVTAPDNVPVSASFKTSDEDFEILPNRPGFIPAPYLARNKWIFVDDISRFARKDWEKYLQSSYGLIVSKLPLRVQKEIASGKSVVKTAPAKKKAAAKKNVVKNKKVVSKKTAVRKKKKN